MWRQTLRVIPTFRGGSSVKVQYGHVVPHSQQQQQATPGFYIKDPINDLLKELEKKPKNEEETHVWKNIELVPANIQKYLFPNLTQEQMEAMSDDLFDMIELPELNPAVFEKGLMAHFDELGKEQFSSYEELLLSAMAMLKPPQMPSKWIFASGWTRYDPVTGETSSVEYPGDKVLFFDVEVCVQDGPLACLAVAMSPNCWYSWCSDRLINDSAVPVYPKLDHLVPMEQAGGSKEPKVVIGHNVGFDRARVREQYFPEKTGTRFWDTMSMNIAVYGMAEHQKKIYEQSDLSEAHKEEWVDAWRSRVSSNGLGAIHAKLCGDSTQLVLNKSMQDVFVKEDIQTIRDHFQKLTKYCAEDVQATFEIFQKLYPVFRERFAHPITSVGMMEMASAFLPITENWRLFYEECNKETAERNDLAAKHFVKASAAVCAELLDKFESDPWMWLSDWKKGKSNRPKWFLNIFSSVAKASTSIDQIQAADVKFRCRDVPRMFGICYGIYPIHFKSDYGWGYLVPSERAKNCQDFDEVKVKRGETIKIPNKAILELIERNQNEAVPELPVSGNPVAKVGVFDFYRLLHPMKPGANVGNPFAKDFLLDFEQGVLRATRHEAALNNYLATLKETRFWGNYKDRFQEEITVWLDDDNKIGAIAPAIIPAGTITRRATHKLWLTSSSPKDGMIGTALKSMIQCTNGWKLVGADVDSQEQWLAALLGDVVVGKGQAGSTAFSNMLLAGSKSDNSDLHSVVAQKVGISRNHAKVLNYARLYGAGKKHAVEFLKQQAIEQKAAENYTEALFTTTKGQDQEYRELNPDLKADFYEFLKTCPEERRCQYIEQDNNVYLPVYKHTNGQLSCIFEDWMRQKMMKEGGNFGKNNLTDQVMFLVKLYPKYPQSISLFKNGYESHTFNFLEMKALERTPSTPILGCRLSQALEKLPDDVPGADKFSQKYKRTVINWVIQSTAVDFLHMLLVSMKWLCDKYDIKARFVLSIHDEIRYLVAEEDQYRAALALNLSNMYVRAAISQKLGINQLPKSIAFFSQVDIDTVLRKEVDQKCKTPDGRVIPPGDALDLKGIIVKTGGSLSKEKQPSNC